MIYYLKYNWTIKEREDKGCRHWYKKVGLSKIIINLIHYKDKKSNNFKIDIKNKYNKINKLNNYKN